MRVINVRADGTIQESMAGVVLPAGHEIYELLVQLERERHEEESDD